MGFFDFLKRKKVVGKQAVPADAAPADTIETATPTSTATVSKGTTTPTVAKGTTKATPAANAPCAATTQAGTPCKSASRDGSKYCGRHKGYRASSTATKANGTAKAAKTNGAARSAKTNGSTKAKTNGAKGGQVTHGEYKLYQNGNRFFFSKKTQAEARSSGAQPVYAMPDRRTVVVTPNGLPVLKKQ